MKLTYGGCHFAHECNWQDSGDTVETIAFSERTSQKVYSEQQEGITEPEVKPRRVEELKEQLRLAEVEELAVTIGMQKATLHGISSLVDTRKKIKLCPSLTANVEFESILVKTLLDAGSCVTIEFLIETLLWK